MPEQARGVFPVGRLPLAVRYAELLAGPGVVRGLIGPREAPRLWDRHLLNCAAVAATIPAGADVCDVGSGAGLPGIVLAIARPDVRVTLVEPLLRRTSFLEEAVAELGLEAVSVVRGRAEVLHGEATFDVVTARAVAPLGRLLDWSMPLVRPSGELVALKGAAAADEATAARDDLVAWGCATPRIDVVESAGATPTYLLRVAWSDPAGLSWPPARRDRPKESGRRSAGSTRPVRGRSPSRKSSRQQRPST